MVKYDERKWIGEKRTNAERIRVVIVGLLDDDDDDDDEKEVEGGEMEVVGSKLEGLLCLALGFELRRSGGGAGAWPIGRRISVECNVKFSWGARIWRQKHATVFPTTRHLSIEVWWIAHRDRSSRASVSS